MRAASRKLGFALAASLAVATISTAARAQDKADVDAVFAASQAFDKALSARDIAAVSGFWAQEPYAVKNNRNGKSLDIGWDAVRADYEALFGLMSDMSVTTREPQIHVSQNVAWLIGVQTLRAVFKDGRQFTNVSFETNVYEKRKDQWLLVSHVTARVAR